MSGTYSLNKNLGFPLRARDNGDGTCTLEVISSSTPVFDGFDRIPASFGSTQTTPGVEQVLYSATAPADKKYYITAMNISCRQDGIATLYIDGAAVGAIRTSSAQINADLNLYPASEIVNANTTVEIKFLPRTNAASTSVEFKIQGFSTTI